MSVNDPVLIYLSLFNPQRPFHRFNPPRSTSQYRHLVVRPGTFQWADPHHPSEASKKFYNGPCRHPSPPEVLEASMGGLKEGVGVLEIISLNLLK